MSARVKYRSVIDWRTLKRNKWPPLQRNSGELCAGISGDLCCGIVTYYRAEYPQRDGPFQIYYYADGITTKLIDDITTEYMHPKWSPSGKFLLYFKHKQPENPKIEIIDFKTKKSIFTLEGNKYEFLDWSPNEHEILAYEYGGRLLKIDFANGRITAVTDNFGEILSADWSKMTHKISFSADENIYVVNSDGTGLKQICTQGLFPSWHPSDDKIIFVKAEEGLPIYEVDSTGDNLQLLFNGKKKRK